MVHRIAYLIRARRENPRGILALAYNRHAAVDIRRRLNESIGADARGVTVLTCHALAMRLAGASFTGRADRPDDELFREILRRAVELLRGKGLPPEEADEQRERLLSGFRWILVDEYQDIGADQYALISALAGRTLEDEAGRLTLFAVGDDDQNIYAFNGASVEFIRRFEADYGPKPEFLTANYRSTAHIVAAANAMIGPARQRMKAAHPIHIDRAREKEPPGGAWEKLDPVTRGKVRILPAGRDPVVQARAVMAELQRLSARTEDWDWSRAAVVAREWKYLVPVRAFCEAHDIPAQMGDEEIPGFWRLRETRAFVEWLRGRSARVVDGAALAGWAEARPAGPWHDLLRQAIEEHGLETGGAETPVGHFIEWLAEWGRDIRRRQQGLLLLTGHRAKGLEFDHVAVLDGGWDRAGRDEDKDAPRRLYYVAMTRARQTLTLAQFDGPHPLLDALHRNRSVMHRGPAALAPGSAALEYRYIRPGSMTSTWALPVASTCTVRSIAPSPPCRPATGWRRALPRAVAGNCWTATAGRSGASPRDSGRHPACGAAPPKCWPSSAGTAMPRSLNTATARDAIPGKWWSRNWCSSRTNRKGASMRFRTDARTTRG